MQKILSNTYELKMCKTSIKKTIKHFWEIKEDRINWGIYHVHVLEVSIIWRFDSSQINELNAVPLKSLFQLLYHWLANWVNIGKLTSVSQFPHQLNVPVIESTS